MIYEPEILDSTFPTNSESEYDADLGTEDDAI
jgi:hypothetical protein